MKQKHMSYRGYIEGYFGKKLDWNDRFAIVDQLSSLGQNVYLYAPKEDPYHRVHWRRPYPENWQQRLAQLFVYGQDRGVTVIPALAPGLSYDYLEEPDYLILLEKFKACLTMGMQHIALLMDDISPELPEKCAAKYSSLGHAHGELLAKLRDDLIDFGGTVKLWFCPTIYCDQFAGGKGVDSEYLVDLKKHIPEQVSIMWTGQEIVAKNLTEESCGELVQMFDGKVIFWDNLYANDYAPLRLFLGPYQGRSHSLIDEVEGILINPTGMVETDKFLLVLFNDFLINGEASEERWCQFARDYGLPERFIQLRHFFWLPHLPVPESVYSRATVKEYGDIYNELIVPWVHHLKMEWFAHLQALYLDFVYVNEGKENNNCWLQRRYPIVIAEKMKKSA